METSLDESMATTTQVATKPTMVAHLGPLGTYTHEITEKTFPEPDYKLIAYPTISETIYSLLDQGEGDSSNDQNQGPSLAVVPIENSSFGPVEETLNVLKDPFVSSSTQILDQKLKLKIHHCLLAPKLDHHLVNSSSQRKSIQKIFSHVQALGQCKNYIEENYPKVEKVYTSSTIEAAEIVSKDETKTSLAICSANCLNYFSSKLEIIDSNIQDAGQENVTTFIILKKTV